MKFCIKCDNMYYIGINEENKNELTHYCRNCGFIDHSNIKENSCILNVDIKKGEQKYSHIVNEYTKLDPTLPRINTIDCPNKECASNTTEGKSQTPQQEKEILYVRYDDKNMKFVYMCAVCDTIWKTENK